MYFNSDFEILAQRIARTKIILAQNFRENNANFEYIRYVISNLILILSSRKIVKNNITLKFGKKLPMLGECAMYFKFFF
jgi:hypothetical protein